LYLLERLILEILSIKFKKSFLTIYSYCNCTISSKIYCINNNSKKYIKYIQSSCNYNLTICLTLIKQIYKKQIYLKKEIRKIYTKFN